MILFICWRELRHVWWNFFHLCLFQPLVLTSAKEVMFYPVFVVSQNFMKWKFWLTGWSVAFVCVWVCLFAPYSSQFKAIFTTLYTQVGISPRKNWLNSESHLLMDLDPSLFKRILQHCEIGQFSTLISLEKPIGSSWKFFHRCIFGQGLSAKILKLIQIRLYTHRWHDRVLNIPNPVPLHYLWPRPKFRLALNLWSISYSLVCHIVYLSVPMLQVTIQQQS